MNKNDNNEEMCMADGSTIDKERELLEEQTPIAKPTKHASKPKPVKSPSPPSPKPVAPPPPAVPAPPAKPAPKAPLPESMFKRIDINALYPAFLAKLSLVLAECEARGARYYVLSGHRGPEEQNALYAQGRSDKTKPKVTNARAWQSFHQYHGAADMCRDQDLDRAGLQPDWNLESYRILAEVAVKHGLEAAFNWTSFQEGPHIQLPFESRGLTKELLRDAYLSGGRAALYALLDMHQW